MRNNVSGYDIIGDIHGHSDALERLLIKLDYSEKDGCYSHVDRKVIFVGDFIDRGPKILRTLHVAKNMVESGSALAVLGNHELNAIAYQTRETSSHSRFMRPRDDKNFAQHKQTLNQLSASELTHFIDWFRKLPLWLDLDGLRIVHACWDNTSMEVIHDALKEGQGIDDAFIRSAYREGSDLYKAVEIISKGKEAKLPKGIYFTDKDGHCRESIRMRWFLPTENQTYRNYALQSDPIDCDLPLEIGELDAVPSSLGYPETEPPVFIGHYWLSSVTPEYLAPNVACLDYSVAKDGFLCAYRWDGEQKLRNEKFVC